MEGHVLLGNVSYILIYINTKFCYLVMLSSSEVSSDFVALSIGAFVIGDPSRKVR